MSPERAETIRAASPALGPIARGVATDLAPDSANARADRLYAEAVEGTVHEALIDALANAVGALPSFEEWCAERDVAQRTDLDEDER